jgi:peptidoglycan/xylan/chitin deacetylase (PgdA/CDA1 family)
MNAVNHTKRLLAGLAGAIFFTTPYGRSRMRDTAVVVAFHRVSGATADALTIDESTFENLCEFFSQHFEVIPLREQISRLEVGQPIGGTLSITFDDGYHDNHEIAAPILRTHKLPATFFIVTEFIGSTHIAPWDEDRREKTTWMTWDEVRDLYAKGFDLGAHTMTHADLGSVSRERAWQELIGSRERIALEIGTVPDLFAFPYGQPHNIRPETKELVRQAGFRCCLSSYGGVNGSASDPFELCRIPINHWYQNVPQLSFELVRSAQRLRAERSQTSDQ